MLDKPDEELDSELAWAIKRPSRQAHSSTVQALKAHNIRVSIIGLAAEVHICRHICKETSGEYGVLLDDHHLKQLIMNLVQPPVAGGKNALV